MKVKAVIGLAGLLVVTPSFAQQTQVSSGPVADYWMDVSTTTGMAGMLSALAGRPSLGALFGMAMRGPPSLQAVNHSLTLRLGSTMASPAPLAEHIPPPGLAAGPTLPLLTPNLAAAPQPPPRADEPPTLEKYQQQKPRGRILIYWGCGEHAGPNQPYVIDFAKMMADPQSMVMMASIFKSLALAPERPPSAVSATTFGDWPNAKSNLQIPANGSLVGDHLIRGNYTPDIHFTLGPQNDFLGPFTLTQNERTPSGSVALAWAPVAGAQAYLATVFGAGADDTMVMWTSSAARMAAFGAPQYLSNGEIRRLVGERALLDPNVNACLVPQEAAAAAAHGFLSLNAFGGEVNFSDPPRPSSPRQPWNLRWTVKVRYRSATSALLGQPMPGGPDQSPPSTQDRLKSALHGLGGFIPH